MRAPGSTFGTSKSVSQCTSTVVYCQRGREVESCRSEQGLHAGGAAVDTPFGRSGCFRRRKVTVKFAGAGFVATPWR